MEIVRRKDVFPKVLAWICLLCCVLLLARQIWSVTLHPEWLDEEAMESAGRFAVFSEMIREILVTALSFAGILLTALSLFSRTRRRGDPLQSAAMFLLAGSQLVWIVEMILTYARAGEADRSFNTWLLICLNLLFAGEAVCGIFFFGRGEKPQPIKYARVAVAAFLLGITGIQRVMLLLSWAEYRRENAGAPLFGSLFDAVDFLAFPVFVLFHIVFVLACILSLTRDKNRF